ncbi:MAG: hypothetical protein GXO79_03045 [Chlorobi bacterium]|nr:hypothetical protein [Chlorobiota bacterium]
MLQKQGKILLKKETLYIERCGNRKAYRVGTINKTIVMKKLFFLLFAMALFSCENNISDVRPFIKKDISEFNHLKDGTVTPATDSTSGGEIKEKPILDP